MYSIAVVPSDFNPHPLIYLHLYINYYLDLILGWIQHFINVCYVLYNVYHTVLVLDVVYIYTICNDYSQKKQQLNPH